MIFEKFPGGIVDYNYKYLVDPNFSRIGIQNQFLCKSAGY